MSENEIVEGLDAIRAAFPKFEAIPDEELILELIRLTQAALRIVDDLAKQPR